MIASLKRQTTAAVAAAALVFGTVAAVPASAQTTAQAANSSGLTIPIVGSVVGGGTLTNATLRITQFAVQNGQLVANGVITGTVTNAAGIATSILQTVTVPVAATTTPATAAPTPAQTTTSCSILHLDIAPISLNLLGLTVNTSEIVLDIGAQPGPGNLLGNLLCSVTGLLDSPGGLSRLLNQILGILG